MVYGVEVGGLPQAHVGLYAGPVVFQDRIHGGRHRHTQRVARADHAPRGDFPVTKSAVREKLPKRDVSLRRWLGRADAHRAATGDGMMSDTTSHSGEAPHTVDISSLFSASCSSRSPFSRQHRTLRSLSAGPKTIVVLVSSPSCGRPQNGVEKRG